MNICDIYNEDEGLSAEKSKYEDEIFALMEDKSYTPLKYKELCESLGVPEEDKKEFFDLLIRLEREVRLIKTKNNKYMPLPKNMLVGTFMSTRKGFGFVRVDGYEDDFFVSIRDTLDAFDGDRVLISVKNTKSHSSSHKSEARIERIVSRLTTSIMGVYEKAPGKKYGFVIPRNRKISSDIYIPAGESAGAVDGNIVIADITSYGDSRKSPTATVTEIIGHIDDPSSDILQVVRAFGIPDEFPEDVEQQLETIPEEVDEADKVGREDFRGLLTVTIDGEDAKDLDDAITLEYKDGIYTLGVHIADVSHYVKEASPLDKEALRRGTSNYLVDSVIPMLPHKLSNGICSLNHDTDRLTLSCVMDIDKDGRLLSHRIVEGLINVNERMNYTDVAAILENSPDAPVERYKYLVPMFVRMQELSGIIRAAREKRGSVDFDLAETKIIVDENHKPVDIKPYERNCATGIIEDFMLMANETVAEEFFWSNVPFEYRVHEAPTEEKVESLRMFLKNFGIYFRTKGEIHPKEYQRALREIKGEPYEALVSRLILRSMQQARYSTICSGHFGLACKYYCHFTSPIRRYPDLQIHRIIKEHLHGELTDKRISHYDRILPRVAEDNSRKERRSVDAEREVVKLKEIEYMSEHIGEIFDGIISGFTAQTVFVELPSTIEGGVRVDSMYDDFYTYNEEKYEMTGRNYHRVLKLGDSCRVKLVSTDKTEGLIEFEFV